MEKQFIARITKRELLMGIYFFEHDELQHSNKLKALNHLL